MTFEQWCKANNVSPLWVLIHDLKRWERAIARYRRYLDRQKVEAPGYEGTCDALEALTEAMNPTNQQENK